MVSDEFKCNVESGDVVTVRSALVDYLIIDTSFRQFDEALAFAEQSMDIIESENGQQEYEDDSNNWDVLYLNKQKVALMVNFSQKRIDHLKKVVKKVLETNKKPVEMPKAEVGAETRLKESKTGRTVLSEEPVARQEKEVRRWKDAQRTQNISEPRDNRTRNPRTSSESRTGRRTVEEKRLDVKRTEEDVHPIDIAAWMIVGGITVAAIGGVTAGIGSVVAKPTVVHAGMAVAGAGGIIVVSGGVIKIVRER